MSILIRPRRSFTLTEFVIISFFGLFARRPILTGTATFVVIVGSATTLYLSAQKAKENAVREQQRLLTYSTQLEQLDKVQRNLRELAGFVAEQRGRIEQAEQTVKGLEQEKARIEPLIQADRKIVDAVFQLQEQRAAVSVAHERWIGFGLGVGASLIASFLYSGIMLAWRRRTARRDATSPDKNPA